MLDLCLTKQRASNVCASCRKTGYEHKSPENDSDAVRLGVERMRREDPSLLELQQELAKLYKGYNLEDVRQVERSQLNSGAERMAVHAAGMWCKDKKSPVVVFHGTSKEGAKGIVKQNQILFSHRQLFGLGVYGSENAR